MQTAATAPALAQKGHPKGLYLLEAMANGVPFNPNANHAAHRTLPFGTVAQVTNLRTGASTIVVISDRGPFTPGRVIDLSPHSARQIGMGIGLAQVEIRPLVEVAEAR